MITLLIIGLGVLLLFSFANSSDTEVVETSEPTATTPNVGTVTTNGVTTTVVSRRGAETPVDNVQRRDTYSTTSLNASVLRATSGAPRRGTIENKIDYVAPVTTDPVSNVSNENMANTSPPEDDLIYLRRVAAVTPVSETQPASVSSRTGTATVITTRRR